MEGYDVEKASWIESSYQGSKSNSLILFFFAFPYFEILTLYCLYSLYIPYHFITSFDLAIYVLLLWLLNLR